MSLERLVTRYIRSAEHVLDEIKVAATSEALDKDIVLEVIDQARAYVDDAKYYRTKKRLDVSLASVAYCEGLLDALKLLELVKFEWPVRRKESSENARAPTRK